MGISLLFAVLGALVYGEYVEILVLSNLFYWPTDDVAVVVAAVTILNLCGSLSFIMTVCGELADEALSIEAHERRKRYVVRAMFVGFCTVMAYCARYDLSFMTCLASVYVLIGGSAFLMPLILYIKVFYHELSAMAKAVNYALVMFAVTLAVLIIEEASQGLIA